MEYGVFNIHLLIYPFLIYNKINRQPGHTTILALIRSQAFPSPLVPPPHITIITGGIRNQSSEWRESSTDRMSDWDVRMEYVLRSSAS